MCGKKYTIRQGSVIRKGRRGVEKRRKGRDLRKRKEEGTKCATRVKTPKEQGK